MYLLLEPVSLFVARKKKKKRKRRKRKTGKSLVSCLFSINYEYFPTNKENDTTNKKKKVNKFIWK